ncbi:MAG TPA: hypothetical protein VGQ57_13910 [Polyangiaceae bacterium]|nr:hypothetical protein [Polyangiaceae bacterium]
MRGKWPYFRALAITWVLALALVAGLPSRLPKLVAYWPKPLAKLALELPALQGRVLAPFAPLTGALGLGSEDWPLFTGTGGTRYRMWIEAQGRKNTDFVLLYRAQDGEHQYLAGALEYRRVLNMWNPHHAYISDGYPAFTRWLARRIFRDYRRYQRVRVRMEEVTIRPAGEGFVPTGHFVYEQGYTRDEVGE